MVLTKYYDSSGKLKAVYLPEGETDTSMGIPCPVPDIENGIDWEQVITDIHNQLVERGLFTRLDVQKHQNAITSILRGSLKNKILNLYEMEEKEHE